MADGGAELAVRRPGRVEGGREGLDLDEAREAGQDLIGPGLGYRRVHLVHRLLVHGAYPASPPAVARLCLRPLARPDQVRRVAGVTYPVRATPAHRTADRPLTPGQGECRDRERTQRQRARRCGRPRAWRSTLAASGSTRSPPSRCRRGGWCWSAARLGWPPWS